MQHSWTAWILFHVFIIGMLVLDLVVFHRKDKEASLKEALGWSAFWIALGLAFNGILLFWSEELGLRATTNGKTLSEMATALQFLNAYAIEKSLSMDNVFVFSVIFHFFAIPGRYQHKVLFWGIIGALVMRLGFVLAGITLLRHFHWVVLIFGAILLYTGIQMWRQKEAEIDPEHNLVLKILKRYLPITHELHGNKFFVKLQGVRHATPLFLALVVIEFSDVLFAVDSVPAVLSVTNDTFIAYSSNVFAILGMRALYFALASIKYLFEDLHYGLSFILIFVGGKMLASYFVELPDWFDWVSLAVIASALTVSMGSSVAKQKRAQKSAS